MAVQPTRLFGDAVLRTPARPAVDVDRELRTVTAPVRPQPTPLGRPL